MSFENWNKFLQEVLTDCDKDGINDKKDNDVKITNNDNDKSVINDT